eukprot:TRINITY_DN63379_c0_g1_i1.p1 TRINITY_DN63379_c0_g1~~TRINITY_DN63379_c0_g1_i1.p1  ORF type:complete len:448 (-),score=80.97 TRINITY_DN63379_c0_g1_i1:123-1382(-)
MAGPAPPTKSRSDERLQLNYLTFFEKQLLTDVTIIAQGREIQAHKAVLAAQSEWFLQQFSAGHGRDPMQVPYKYKVIKALVRFMYFGGVSASSDLGPEDGLDMLLLSDDLGITALEANDLVPLIISRLTTNNCVGVLQHEGLMRYPALANTVCEFTGSHLLSMLPTQEAELLNIPKAHLAGVLRVAARYVSSDGDNERIVRYALGHTGQESACDLLRETKQWHWGSDEATLLRSPPGELLSEGQEWCIDNIRVAMESTPARIVVGTYFDWCIRLDYGAEGKLRIVYESATPRGPSDDVPALPNRCINRFPAAMFAWRVQYRGQYLTDVFSEKPVFICFPENASLHWSTTLPVSAADLNDEDDLRIMVNMAENPMLSLVLYYFSADLKTTVFSEDILNRLPHIEYRCLSSYSLVKTHGSS